MSAEDKASYTAVLLPGARVLLYTRDDETKNAFQALEKDWRFARVNLQVRDGGASEAIAAFHAEQSPDIVIIQTDTIDEGFSRKLEELGGVCAEGTGAIVIGPVNDVDLYRKLVGMGVSDYLVKPVRTEPLGNDIAATLIEKIGAIGSRLIAVMGSKGGAGVTSLTEGLAWALADEMKQKTFLLDAAGGWSSLSVGMNFEPSTTLNEAVRAAMEGNNDSLTRMMFTAGERLTVLSSGGDVMLDDLVPPENFEVMLDHLMTTYPVMLVDLSGAPAGLKRIVLTRAHKILLVTPPTLPAVRATRTLLQEMKDLRGGSVEEVDVIINMSGIAPKHEVPKAQIEEGLERKVAAVLPFDPALFIRTESEAKKLSDDKAGHGIVEKIMPLVRKVLASAGSESVAGNDDAEEDKKGGIGGLLTKLKVKS